MINRIQWLGHASFRIQGSPLIYINPWRIAQHTFPADVILVTTDLYDHCSPADIEKLRGPHTLVIANSNAAAVLGRDVMVLRPWQCVTVGDACISAVPAYTFTDFQPISKGGLGFVISIDYYDIYYAGLTDLVPELDRLQADIAIVPLAAGSGTLNLERTVDLTRSMQPRWVVPSHWGTMDGTQLDAQVLAHALEDQANVVIGEQIG